MTPSKPDSVAAVMKVFAVLEALAEQRTVGLGEIAQRVVTSKSTAYRLMQTMVDLGYVAQEGETEKYGLTLKIFNLGARVLNRHNDLIRVSDKAMSALAQKSSEAVHLGILDAPTRTVVYIHKFDSAFNLSLQSPLGKRNPLHSTSLGKALLAWRDAPGVSALLSGMTFAKSAPNTIPDPATLITQLAVTRERGYAEEVEESEAGVRCMAAPVFDHEGKTAAAISVSFPVARFEEARKEEYVEMLLEAGRAASSGMGYLGAYPTR